MVREVPGQPNGSPDTGFKIELCPAGMDRLTGTGGCQDEQFKGAAIM